MPSPRKVSLVSIVLALFLITFAVYGVRAEGEIIQIQYFKTDDSVYEVGQTVNATAVWFIDYGDGLSCSEAAISCLRGGSIIESKEWLNEPQGYHVHHAFFLLDPEVWNPGEAGENGVADCLITLPMSEQSSFEEQSRTFTVKRARQNCSLIGVSPAQPMANDSSVSLFFKAYNANNQSFGVGLNRIYCNITNPFGRNLMINNKTTTDTDGNFVIPFNPDFTRGDYLVSLISSENGKYLEGRFIHNLTVGRSPIPTVLTVDWRYAGYTVNCTETYALEPVEAFAELTQTSDQIGIGSQQIDFTLLDALSLKTVSQTIETTNASGFATCTLIIPYEGEFTLEASYGGSYGMWLSSLDASSYSMEARVREVELAELVGPPSVVNLGQEYSVKYTALDALSGRSISELGVMLNADGLLLANGTTDNEGTVGLSIYIPIDRWDLSGNLTLSIDIPSKSERGIYGNSSLIKYLLCKIPTVTTLRVRPSSVVEDGETVLVSAQLLSLNFTPISAQEMTFAVFSNQKGSPLMSVTEVTDTLGTCDVLLKLSEPGSVMIIARFSGSFVFDCSNDTCSTSVFPSFSERLYSSISSTSLMCLLSIILVLLLARTKRKVSWRQVSIPKDSTKKVTRNHCIRD